MERIDAYLHDREAKGLLRQLRPASLREGGLIFIDGKEYVDFSSNDYLGLSDHTLLKEASKKAIERLGTSASASRLLSGDLEIFHQLQDRVASLKGKEAALIFNSGYQLIVGLICAVCQKGDAIFSDKLNHASIIDGAMLSGADLIRFRHNDMEHLETLLQKHQGRYKHSLIITETVFSMDGDKAPLDKIVKLKEEYGCTLLVDEAHATGIFGKNGTGMVEEYGLTDEVDLIMGTFSKALGSFGAYLASSRKIYDYLVNACRSFIYSTALPPAVMAANLVSLDLLEKESYRRKELLETSDYFRNKLTGYGFKTKGSSQVIPLIVGDSKKAVEMSARLRKKGYWVLPIRPPTVPPQSARLRFSLTHHHSKDMLDRLIDEIHSI